MTAADKPETTNTNSDAPTLEFTGERFTPENTREIWYEHYHRYALASQMVDGLQVLDAASGEGYGSQLLATKAASVTAVDISDQAIIHARQRYAGTENLEFIQADCCQLDLGDKKFDAIISFETLEHLEEQETMLAGFRRLLKPGGWLLISSPDKAEYSDAKNYSNPWHIKELYRQEFEDLLAKEFPAVSLYGQSLAFHSIIWNLQSSGKYQSQVLGDGELGTTENLQLTPLYYLALCAATDEYFPKLPELNLFADQQASVYQHYYHEIRKNMAAGELLLQRDQKIAELEGRLKDSQATGAWFSRWFKR